MDEHYAAEAILMLLDGLMFQDGPIENNIESLLIIRQEVEDRIKRLEIED